MKDTTFVFNYNPNVNIIKLFQLYGCASTLEICFFFLVKNKLNLYTSIKRNTTTNMLCLNSENYTYKVNIQIKNVNLYSKRIVMCNATKNIQGIKCCATILQLLP